ncbi:hypothetical protein D3C72_2390920 [compost metagenome]
MSGADAEGGFAKARMGHGHQREIGIERAPGAKLGQLAEEMGHGESRRNAILRAGRV